MPIYYSFHRLILIRNPDADIISFDGEKIPSIEYEEQEPIMLWKVYYNHQQLINELLKE